MTRTSAPVLRANSRTVSSRTYSPPSTGQYNARAGSMGGPAGEEYAARCCVWGWRAMCRLVRASSKSSGGGSALAFGGESGSHRISSAGGSWGLSSASLGKEEARCLRGGFSGAGSVGSASGGESEAARTQCCSSMTGCDDASRLCTLDDGRSGCALLTLDSFGDFVRARVGLRRAVGLLDALRTVLASCEVLRMSVLVWMSCGLAVRLGSTFWTTQFSHGDLYCSRWAGTDSPH